MRKSDGLCKLCNDGLENLEHLFYSCNKLSSLWGDLAKLINSIFDIQVVVNYKMIILGDQVGPELIYNITNMLISMLKWEIWLRRNEYVFENTFKSAETVWETFRYKTKNHCITLTQSKNIIKKISGLDTHLSIIIAALV